MLIVFCVSKPCWLVYLILMLLKHALWNCEVVKQWRIWEEIMNAMIWKELVWSISRYYLLRQKPLVSIITVRTKIQPCHLQSKSQDLLQLQPNLIYILHRVQHKCHYQNYDHVSCNLFLILRFHGKCFIQNICLQAWTSSPVSSYLIFWWTSHFPSFGLETLRLSPFLNPSRHCQSPRSPKNPQETSQRTLPIKK
jgi:hypothetical protein